MADSANVKSDLSTKDENENDVTHKKSKHRFSKKKLRSFGLSIYDHEKRLFLGRNSKSWAMISLYYAGFYAFLFAFFVAIFAIFESTINKNLPKYYNTRSVLDYRGVNPGLGFRPMEPETSNLICLSDDKEKSMEAFKNLEAYVKYFLYSQNTSVNNIIDCMENVGDYLEKGRVCKYTWHDLMEAEPNHTCSLTNNAGYTSRSPCVVIKLNKIIGWVPTRGNNTELEKILNMTLPQNYVFFTCAGMYPADVDNFPDVTYYSLYAPNGNKHFGALPYSYFPYFNIYNYIPPFVVVKFDKIPENLVINVVCKAWAPNIDNTNNLNYRGMTLFQIFYQKST